MVSLVSLPEDIKLRLLDHLDAQDARNLSTVHSSWTVPARTIIFRRIETVKRTNATLGHLVESMLPVIGGSIRRLGLSFAWSAVSGRMPSAAEMDDWLLGRDTFFSAILDKAAGLRILRIRFQYESPYVDSTIQAQLDRCSLTRTARALCRRDGLQTLQLDFHMPGRPYGLHSAILLPVIFADILTQSGTFPNLTTLSLANITVADDTTRGQASAKVDVFKSFCSFVQSLPALRHLQLDNFICPPSSLAHILPSTIESFELLDDFRHFNAQEVFQALAGNPNLLHLRFAAHERNFSSVSHSAASSANQSHPPPTLVALRRLCLECPGKFGERWLQDIVSFLERGYLQLPYLHTLCLNVKVWSLTEVFNGKYLGRALSNRTSFPCLKVLQIPVDDAGLVWLAKSDFQWTRVLRQVLNKNGIELQFSEDAVRHFKLFMAALQRVE